MGAVPNSSTPLARSFFDDSCHAELHLAGLRIDGERVADARVELVGGRDSDEHLVVLERREVGIAAILRAVARRTA